ncbi:probable cytochrome c-554 [Blastopirellula marina DSM 3645]|uniref:Probable cytochrome c-554 n=2 Tax=Blastopirellula marina TaxID=124 RepID=A3ZY60_9BACT|nr:probable cytochrome c-554 [Blastopirellula marina DSM 3645]
MLLACAVAVGGCSRASSKVEPVTVVVSGDTHGWIVPCGCTSNQSGGLLRRGSYLAALRRRGPVLYFDCGGAGSGDSPYDIAKLAAIIRGEQEMGLVLHNIGAAEASLGAADLRQLAESLGGDVFLSANVRDAAGERIGAAWEIVEQGGQKLLVTGVLSPQFATADLQVGVAKNEILAVIAETASQGPFTAIIVLAYAPEAELRQLVAQLPEVDAVIGGPTGQAIAPQRVGRTVLAAATNKGKFLIELTLSNKPGEPITGSAIEMEETYPDQPQQQGNLQRFYQLLAEQDFMPSQTSFAAVLPYARNTAARIVGNHSCQKCHTDEYEAWLKSPHAHAWRTLEADGSHVDSYCQQCHVTGYGAEGGFASRKTSTAMVNVGCESCHGPSEMHAKDPQTPTSFFANAAAACTGCHDRENSPHFDYSTYWPQIEHGGRSTDQ